jgi:hypothetical protein
MHSYGGVWIGHAGGRALAWSERLIPYDWATVFEQAWQFRPGLARLGARPAIFPPAVLAGTFCWPVGASRWTYASYLVDDAMLAAIRPLAYIGNSLTSLPLTFLDDLGNVLTTYLYMLPPRPLAQSGDNQIWLMMLVDDRFFWWFRAANIVVTPGTTTWTQLFTSLATGLNVTLNVDAVPSVYLKPSGDLNGMYEALPPMLDVAALSVGMRVVRRFDGTVSVIAPTTSTTQYAANLNNVTNGRVAGGFLSLTPGT